MYVIGTAGHVDHGKSALVQAVTGIDPDRLREEKERGMTIDLGFAWLNLPSGEEVGIVDVPGHERFIKNMLAGVGSIDLALLVIAADEGVMPQTREHLAILDFLDIHHGIVAITKSDLVDEDLLALLETEARDLLSGTTLAAAPIVACSATTGAGLGEFLASLDDALANMPPKRDLSRPRLSIDRVFSVAGFGTVVTGTLVDGTLSVGQGVEVLPGRERYRIRGLQNHQRRVEVAHPGSRTAVNLVGAEKEDLDRGMVLTSPGWLQPTSAVDVILRTARDTHPLRHGLEVTFHSGASEVPARLLLLDSEELKPGEGGWAQVRLDAPVAVVRSDFFVIRSPNETIGGGRIVDVDAPRHRRFHASTLEALAKLERGSPDDLLLTGLEKMGPCALAQVAETLALPADRVLAAAAQLIQSGRAVLLSQGEFGINSLVSSTAGFVHLTERATETLGAYHGQHRLRAGMPKEELRSRLGLSPAVFTELIEFWVRQGQIEERGNAVSLPGHTPRPTAAQQKSIENYLAGLKAAPYSPSIDSLPVPELLAHLESERQIVRAGDIVFAAAAYDEMVTRIIDHVRDHGKITLAEVRDMFGTSRKYAQAVLEHLDERHITRRIGDERVLRNAEALLR